MGSLIRKTALSPGYNEYWLSVPSQRSILYLHRIVYQKTKFLYLEIDEDICGIEYITGRGVEIRKYPFDRSFTIEMTGSDAGTAIFILTPHLYRGQVESEEISSLPKGLDKYLRDESDIDMRSSLVQKKAAEILNGLSVEKRDNLYWKAAVAFQWIKQNISYSILPKERIEQIADIIKSLPEDRRNDPYTILKLSYPRLRSDYLYTVASRIVLSRYITDPFQKAQELMNAATAIWPIFQFSWAEGGKTSASQTIKDGMGKCVGIANTFVALCRALGVPAKTCGGYADYGISRGRHAWSHTYLPPYGWKEADPTNSIEFDHFSFEKYGYEFLKYNPSCEAILVPDIISVPKEYIEEIKELASRKYSPLDKPSRRKITNPVLEILEKIL